MNAVKITGYVDESRRWRAQVPDEVTVGPVQLVILQPEVSEDKSADAWAAAIAQAWAEDWSDPREDIYSLEDGEAIDETR